ncbi:RidA family protein [Bradyrhizobium sp. 191]|nr:RidA family protein [Bradyrhizobium sp. 191]
MPGNRVVRGWAWCSSRRCSKRLLGATPTEASVGATFADVIKVNHYLTDIRAQLPILREVRDSFVNTAAPPASTTVEVSRLAADAALFEVEAIVALPPR